MPVHTWAFARGGPARGASRAGRRVGRRRGGADPARRPCPRPGPHRGVEPNLVAAGAVERIAVRAGPAASVSDGAHPRPGSRAAAAGRGGRQSSRMPRRLGLSARSGRLGAGHAGPHPGRCRVLPVGPRAAAVPGAAVGGGGRATAARAGALRRARPGRRRSGAARRRSARRAAAQPAPRRADPQGDRGAGARRARRLQQGDRRRIGDQRENRPQPCRADLRQDRRVEPDRRQHVCAAARAGRGRSAALSRQSPHVPGGRSGAQSANETLSGRRLWSRRLSALSRRISVSCRFLGNFWVPRTVDHGLSSPIGEVVVVNLVLLGLSASSTA